MTSGAGGVESQQPILMNGTALEFDAVVARLGSQLSARRLREDTSSAFISLPRIW